MFVMRLCIKGRIGSADESESLQTLTLKDNMYIYLNEVHLIQHLSLVIYIIIFNIYNSKST